MRTIRLSGKACAMLVAVIGILLFGSSVATAQVLNDEPIPEVQNVIRIEEIVVTAERSFFLLRSQIEYAKERLYSTYNDFNGVDDFDVNCKQTDWTMTHIQEQVCWPVFFEKIVAKNSQDGVTFGDFYILPVGQLVNQYNQEFDEVRANMLRVANENPQVAEALLNLGKIEQAYKLKREECMKEPAFLLILRRCQ